MTRAFTLIELLVVITIIVVLISLLAPSLDKAIHHAEMTVCAARLDGIATGLSIYAIQNNRHYPYRPLAEGGWWTPESLAEPNSTSGDVRLMLRGLVSMESYNDPLCGGVEFDPASTTGSRVMGNYSIWCGLRYPGNKAMRRVGDRFTWLNQEFDLLVSDWDLRWEGTGSEGSHPDEAGIMLRYLAQNQGPTDTGITGNNEADAALLGRYTYSRWFNNKNLNPRRGLVDENFAFQDGSVKRLDDMKAKAEEDDRLTMVPLEASANNWATLKLQVPKP